MHLNSIISMVIYVPMLTHVVQGNSEHAPDLAISQSTVGGACSSIYNMPLCADLIQCFVSTVSLECLQ